MKKYRLSLIVMMLVGILLCCPIIGNADVYAEDEPQRVVLEGKSYINPVYENEVTEGDLRHDAPAKAKMLPKASTGFETVEDAGKALGTQLKARAYEISIKYNYSATDIADAREKAQQAMVDIVNESFKHTGDPEGGDYLRWHCVGFELGDPDDPNDTRKTTGYTYYSDHKCVLDVTYYFTYTANGNASQAAKEAGEVTGAVDALLDDLELDGLSDAKKVEKICRWMAFNISYDYKGAGDINDFYCHSSHSAIIGKKSVCQGYATLLYRLLLEEGIDNRVYGGVSGEIGHVWNLVRIGNGCYWIDATWDSPDTKPSDMNALPMHHLLIGSIFWNGDSNGIKSHAQYKKNPYYSVDSFSMPTSSFSSDCVEHEWEDADTTDLAATCVVCGRKSRHCKNCSDTIGSCDIEANGHDLENCAAVKATCSVSGCDAYVRCKNCDYSTYQPLGTLPHSEENRIAKQATISAPGLEETYCSVCGEVVKSTTIPQPTFALSASSYTYDGKVKTPTVTGKGVQSFKFSAGYPSGRKNVGAYKITVKITEGTEKIAAGSETKTLTFNILPKKATIKTPSKGKNYVTVKWKKQSAKMSKSRITGYQVQLATDSKFTKGVKTYKVKGYKKTSKKIKSLKRKTKYYVRVRTYLGSYYSGWSSVKSTKTK